MSDIKELERRLSAALGRIAAALDRPGEAGGAALDEVQEANGRLEAQVAELSGRLEAAAGEAEGLRRELAARDALAQQLRRVNAQLRDNNDALRRANAAGGPDAHLVNAGIMAELESIRASRDADRAEIDAVLAELAPLLEGADA